MAYPTWNPATWSQGYYDPTGNWVPSGDSAYTQHNDGGYTEGGTTGSSWITDSSGQTVSATDPGYLYSKYDPRVRQILESGGDWNQTLWQLAQLGGTGGPMHAANLITGLYRDGFLQQLPGYDEAQFQQNWGPWIASRQAEGDDELGNSGLSMDEVQALSVLSGPFVTGYATGNMPGLTEAGTGATGAGGIGAGYFGGAELGAGSMGGSTLTGGGTLAGAGTIGAGTVGEPGTYFGGADVGAGVTDPFAGTNLGGMGGPADGLGPLAGGGTPVGGMPAAVTDAGAIAGMGGTSTLPSILTNPSVIGAGLGALAGGLGGTETGTVNTTSTSQLPSWQLPYVQFGLDEAKKWYEGLGGMNNINLDTAINQYNDTMSGKYLDPATNPWLTATYDMAADKVGAGIDSKFAGAGRYGSGAHQGVLGTQLGNLATNIYGGNYQLERDKQWGATQGAPAWNAAVTTASAAPLSIYQGLVGGNYGGTQTGQSPYYSNPLGNLIGGAMLGGTFGKMFGA